MLATRWYPLSDVWSEMNRLHNEMNHVFDSRERGCQALGASYPALNAWEEDDSLYVEAELPGVEMDDLEIHVTGDELSIKGQRKSPETTKARWHRRERGFGQFSRTLTLTEQVDAQKVKAHFNNGVLLIELPKREEDRPRRISVTTD